MPLVSFSWHNSLLLFNLYYGYSYLPWIFTSALQCSTYAPLSCLFHSWATTLSTSTIFRRTNYSCLPTSLSDYLQYLTRYGGVYVPACGVSSSQLPPSRNLTRYVLQYGGSFNRITEVRTRNSSLSGIHVWGRNFQTCGGNVTPFVIILKEYGMMMFVWEREKISAVISGCKR